MRHSDNNRPDVPAVPSIAGIAYPSLHHANPQSRYRQLSLLLTWHFAFPQQPTTSASGPPIGFKLGQARAFHTPKRTKGTSQNDQSSGSRLTEIDDLALCHLPALCLGTLPSAGGEMRMGLSSPEQLRVEYQDLNPQGIWCALLTPSFELLGAFGAIGVHMNGLKGGRRDVEGESQRGFPRGLWRGHGVASGGT